MNRFGFVCDKIIVIESLPDHEKQKRNGRLMSSGEYYIEELFPYCNKFREEPFDFELKTVDSANDLYQYLDLVCRNIKNSGQIPLIHFEVHGRDKQDGITMKNGDFIDWTALLDKLTNINVASANNLFVIFATCSGAFNLKYIMPRERPFPYYAAIAPDKPDFPIFLEQKYCLFYIALIIDGDTEKAFKEVLVNEGYSKIIPSTCEYLLYLAFHETLSNKKSDPTIIDQFVEILSRNSQTGRISRDKLRKMLANKINDPNLGAETLQKMKVKYLMANHPQNISRFGFTVEEIVNHFKSATVSN